VCRYDRFSAYTQQIKRELRFHNSAPHHYWGLFFFHTLRLRATCQLGYVTQAYSDFSLGRLVKRGEGDRPADACGLQGYRALWRPPHTHSGSSTCNASAYPGYVAGCPGAPSHPLRLATCGANASAALHAMMHHRQPRDARPTQSDAPRRGGKSTPHVRGGKRTLPVPGKAGNAGYPTEAMRQRQEEIAAATFHQDKLARANTTASGSRRAKKRAFDGEFEQLTVHSADRADAFDGDVEHLVRGRNSSRVRPTNRRARVRQNTTGSRRRRQPIAEPSSAAARKARGGGGAREKLRELHALLNASRISPAECAPHPTTHRLSHRRGRPARTPARLPHPGRYAFATPSQVWRAARAHPRLRRARQPRRR